MKEIPPGQFFGQTEKTWNLGSVIATETDYTEPYVDWHYHEHMYFTLLLSGGMTEGNQKETYRCKPGTLLFHHWEEPHYNTELAPDTRGFHLEISPKWAAQFVEQDCRVCGSFEIQDQAIRLGFFQALQEIKLDGNAAQPAIDAFLSGVLSVIAKPDEKTYAKVPDWVHRVKTLLHDDIKAPISLHGLAGEAGIHPVHLSRQFPKYFGCSFGSYRRQLRITQSLSLLLQKEYNLTEIAYRCGFADQSHFLRSFKAIMHRSPSQYRKQVLGGC
jgi:AraC family transcriptional regulator